MRYEKFRREYTAGGLTREGLDDCPLRQFECWLEQAVRAELQDPTAMVLATVDEHGSPWQRIVLLKGLSGGGFVFYTNHDSDKARAIAREPCAGRCGMRERTALGAITLSVWATRSCVDER